MKIRMNVTLVFETLMLVMVGAMLAAATQYPIGVRVFPFWIGFPTLFLLLYLWFKDVCPQWKFPGKKRPPEDAGAEKVYEDFDATAWKPILITLGWITAYYLLILVLGFFVATPLWLAAFFIWESGLSPVKSVLSAAVSSYAVIRSVEAFGIALWPGAIPKMIEGILGGGIVPPL
jgi:hypothetical protein